MKEKISKEEIARYAKALTAIREGAKKGGHARAAKLSADQLRESAQKAAQARWNKKKTKRSKS